MNNIKRWTLCAFLFLICFIILYFLGSNKPIMKSPNESFVSKLRGGRCNS